MVSWLVLLVAPVLADSLVMQAPLEAAREVQVFAGRSGVVAEVKGVLGAIVDVGDTLILLDDSALRLDELSAHLVLQQMRSQYDRSLQLLVGGGISAQALEALDFDVQAAEIRYRMAQMEREKAVVRVRMHGVLAEVFVHVGERVSAGQVLARIIDAEDLKAVLYVATDQLAVWGSVIAVGPSRERFTGHVSHISPLVDVASGTCRITVEFSGAGKVLRPGMVVRVHLISAGQ